MRNTLFTDTIAAPQPRLDDETIDRIGLEAGIDALLDDLFCVPIVIENTTPVIFTAWFEADGTAVIAADQVTIRTTLCGKLQFTTVILSSHVVRVGEYFKEELFFEATFAL